MWDIETALDSFRARYYSSNQGMFTIWSKPHAAAASADSIPFVSGSGRGCEMFDLHLKLPYTLNWNVTLERSPDSAHGFSVLTLTPNAGDSTVPSTQMQPKKPDGGESKGGGLL